MSPLEQRLQEALAAMQRQQEEKMFRSFYGYDRAAGPDSTAYVFYSSGRQSGKTHEQSFKATLRKCDTFIPPKRQQNGPGWICAHCRFANDNSSLTNCEDCRIRR